MISEPDNSYKYWFRSSEYRICTLDRWFKGGINPNHFPNFLQKENMIKAPYNFWDELDQYILNEFNWFKWLKENCSEYELFIRILVNDNDNLMGGDVFVDFGNRRDALLFKLTWR